MQKSSNSRGGSTRPSGRRDGAPRKFRSNGPGGRSRPNHRRPAEGPRPKVDVGGRFKPLAIRPDTPIATDFLELGVPKKLAQGLGALGILEPFPIQAATIGDALAGRDVLGRGRTGSGKTLAFGLPLLAQLAGGKTESKHPRGLIMTPTRELAMQVYDSLAPLAALVDLHLVLVIGGAKYERQTESLRRGADIVVATPGRLEDLINRESCSLAKVEIAVLDEADQMADMGFLPIVDELMSLVPRGGQRLLFSATLDNDVDTIVRKHLSNPVEHATEVHGETVTTMEHHVFVVQPRDKYGVIRTIATRKGRCIAFVRTQRSADDLCAELQQIGITADALHGGKSQGARNKALKNLKDGSVNVLVATDVAARGIHVDDIDLVLNVDLPRDFKDYLHRAGRTARAGASGVVVSVCSVKTQRSAKQLMEKAGVEAVFHQVTANSDVLTELTGAQEVHAKRPGQSERVERPARAERAERTERESRPARSERKPRTERPERQPREQRAERSERKPRTARVERNDRGSRSDRYESNERPRRRYDDEVESKPRRRSSERADTPRGNRAERREPLQSKPKAKRRPAEREGRGERKPRRTSTSREPNRESRAERPTRDSQPRKTVKQAKSAKPARSAKPVKTAKPVKAAKPAKKAKTAPAPKSRRGKPRPKQKTARRK